MPDADTGTLIGDRMTTVGARRTRQPVMLSMGAHTQVRTYRRHLRSPSSRNDVCLVGDSQSRLYNPVHSAPLQRGYGSMLACGFTHRRPLASAHFRIYMACTHGLLPPILRRETLTLTGFGLQ